MIYQLPNGQTIELTIEQYIEMLDEDFEFLIAFNYGDVVENPWFGSVLNKHTYDDRDGIIIDDETLPLTDITQMDKLLDLDLDIQEE